MEVIDASRPAIEWPPTIIIILSVVGIALLGGLATDTSSQWYITLNKPSWQPPSWLFAPVWTTLYVLLAISAILVWHKASGEVRTSLMWLYAINGALNLAWSFIFFRGHSPLWAGIEIVVLWGTILLIIIRVLSVSQSAALMLIPYLLWVGLASALTWTIWANNR